MKKFWPVLKNLFVPRILRLRGIIVAPPIMVQSKKFFSNISFPTHPAGGGVWAAQALKTGRRDPSVLFPLPGHPVMNLI